MATKWSESQPVYAGIESICPFLERALGDGQADFFPAGHTEDTQKRRFPIMVRLKELTPRRFAAGDSFFSDPRELARWRARVLVPALYTEGDMKGRTRLVCTALVTRWFFDTVKTNKALRDAIIRITLALPLRDESLPVYKDIADGSAA